MAVVTSASEHLQSETEPEEGVEVHTHTGTISDEEELFALKGEGRNNPDGINEDEAAPDPELEPGSSKWAWAAGGIFLTLCIVLLSGGGTYAHSMVASKTHGAKNVDVVASIEDEVEEDCDEDAYGRRKLDIDSGEDDDGYGVLGGYDQYHRWLDDSGSEPTKKPTHSAKSGKCKSAKSEE
mmetsp:Transcript_22038/g.33698  ORF Transcript_22038/g.33698 Transcript_22038/m.33698 type:complete len:181 (+) Transcript_22038:87-629(+)